MVFGFGNIISPISHAHLEISPATPFTITFQDREKNGNKTESRQDSGQITQWCQVFEELGKQQFFFPIALADSWPRPLV